MRLSYSDGHRLRTVSIRAPRHTSWAAVAARLGMPSTTGFAAEYAGTTVPLTPHLVLGSPPLVHGAVVARGAAGSSPELRAPVSLRVTSGPDVGGCYALRPGHRLIVGRGQWCDVVIDDAGLSRHHLRITTTRDGIVVEDASSTNGTMLGGSTIDGPTVWPPGVPLRAGGTTLDLAPDAGHLGRGRPDGSGGIVVVPRQRPPTAVEPLALPLPEPSTPSAPVPPSVLGWLLPLVVSVVLAVILSMPALMLFGLMAPAMSLGGYAGERRRFRRASAEATRSHREAVTATRAAAQEAVAQEVRRRHDRAPDLAHLIQDAQTTGELLWSRAGEAPIARLGLGRVTTAVAVDGVAETVDRAPIEIDLTGGLVVAGPPDLARAVARSVLLQVAVLHPPGELGITLAGSAHGQDSSAAPVGPASPWDWLAWLPHAAAGDVIRADSVLMVHDLTDDSAAARDLTDHSMTAHGLRPDSASPHAPAAGLTPDVGGAGRTERATTPIPVILCRSLSQAPDVGTTVILRGAVAEVRTQGHGQVVVPDRLSVHRASRVARAMAPLRDGGGHSDSASLPESVSYASISPVALEAHALARSWRDRPRSTGFVLGRGTGGDLRLDLATDGPHALVAGTTGSGKSELLRTLVTSLALGNRPDELVMVLVDYKGGSAFAEAAALPHVVGLITDLDPHLADRALTSLTAELKRRERVLADAGVPDLPAHQGLTGRAPLPRLVIVIDEFRALAEELPGFLDGLVRIAALGRSLGVHLVLATQRPGGVVSADVRANVNLRIALRVRDGSDSYDVIDSPAAADLPEGLPGRALIRTGASPPREVQVATTSTSHATGGEGSADGLSIVTVTDLWGPDTHGAQPHDTADSGQESTLARAVAAATGAAELVGAVPPASPWLPALPRLVPLAGLPEPDEATPEDTIGEPTTVEWTTTEPTTERTKTPGTATTLTTAPGERTAYSVPLLLTDLPAQQCQPVHHWRPLSEGHLGVVGAGRTGRSTVARTVLAGLLSGHPDDVHCYVFDLAGGVGPVGDAPHVGAVLGAADVALGCRVIAHLVRLVADRQRELAAAGHTSLAEQRATGERPWPLVVLVIDGWPRFVELFGEADRGRPLEQVLQVLREGVGAGVVAVVTGDRSLLSGRIASLLPEMWSLRLTDPSDLLMAGLTRAQVPVSMPPGRVIRLRDGVVGQVAVVGASGEGAAQISALTEVVRASTRRESANGHPTDGHPTDGHPTDGPPTDGPAVFTRLPRTVALGRVTAPPSGLLLGLGGDSASPVALPLDPHGVTVAGVLGPPGSGRSTTLRTLAVSARSQGWSVLHVTAEHLRDASCLDPVLADRSATGVLVTVDGLDQVAQTSVEDALLGWLDEAARASGSGPRVLIVAGAPEDFGGFRGLGARVQRERTGIVLQPTSPADGSGLGVAVPTGDEPLPGRGVLVLRGACTAVQVAHADERPE
nr:FtsK/SpoIIIE domain-containing protein [Ornithinimicrobium sp. F0845]